MRVRLMRGRMQSLGQQDAIHCGLPSTPQPGALRLLGKFYRASLAPYRVRRPKSRERRQFRVARFLLRILGACFSKEQAGMSLFGALDTSVSGLTAQSAAFGNISDNVANSQTTGYKGVDTSFIDYLTSSTAQQNDSGSVATRPEYQNTVQGTIAQNKDPLALAISGNGFFAVSVPSGTVSNTNAPSFKPQTYYTRAGDFQMDQNGYLVNSGGDYLQGWAVNASGAPVQSSLGPIQISKTPIAPTATTTVSLSANLPTLANAGSGPFTSQVNVYDASGNQQALTLSWTPPASSTGPWILRAYANGGPTALAAINVTFGSGSANPTSMSVNFPFASGAQPITVSIGNVTQYAASGYTVQSLTQDGTPVGNFTSVTMTDTGNVVVNYDNGQSRVVAQVPVVTFANPNALQRQNTQSFTATQNSGVPTVQAANTNGAGSLVTSAVETSNVDIASEFSKLIVAQEAYGANAKMITTADMMLQTTMNMKT
jgi:flagellar hook protein FlgE